MENLTKELHQFIEHISNIESAMLENHGFCGSFKDNTAKFPREGKLIINNKTIRYKFHGAGCTFKYENGLIIDYDFVSEMGTRVNFSPWKFNRFLESKRPSLKITQQDLLKQIEQLVSDGLLVKHPKGFFQYGLN